METLEAFDHRSMDQGFIGRSRSLAISVARGLTWMHRSSSNGHTTYQFRDRGARRGHTVIARSPSDGHDNPPSSSHLGEAWNALDRPISIGWATPADDGGKQAPIATRSRSDRGAIVTRSSRDRGHDQARSQPPPSRNQGYISSRFIRRRGSRFDHDRGSRSRLDRAPIAPRSGLIHHQVGAELSRN